jgi:uncharacterized membrane protein HdeD (DUF308 family)
MRPFLFCVAASFLLTLVAAAWLLFIPVDSSLAYAVLFPALLLTSTIAGPLLAISDSSRTNFIVLVLASSFLNVVLYTSVFFTLYTSTKSTRRRRRKTSS